MEAKGRIYVAGSNSFIGAAIVRALKGEGYLNIVGLPDEGPDLLNRASVDSFFARAKPEYVFLATGRAAGIMGNIRFPAELMLDNLLVESYVIDSAYRHRVKKLLYMASSCCYPRDCAQPMKEADLLSGPLEPTSEPYAVAKIAGLKLIESYRKQYGLNFISCIPASSFGPGDDFSLEDSHVIGALIRRMHEAKSHNLTEVVVWGTGKPRREFIYAGDLAAACIFIMDKYNDAAPINLGSGEGLSVKELALMIKEVVGFRGRVIFDRSKPDGMPAKILNIDKLKRLGWKNTRLFKKSLQETYAWFLENIDLAKMEAGENR